MFKDNRLQIFGAFICFFSVIYAISYYDIYKGIQACNLCILDRYIFVAIGIIFSLSIWEKKIIISTFNYCFISSFLFWFHRFSTPYLASKTSENNQNNDFANECSADFYYLFERFPFSSAFESIFSSRASCTEVVWSFLGLTIPTVAFIIFSILILISIRIFLRQDETFFIYTFCFFIKRFCLSV